MYSIKPSKISPGILIYVNMNWMLQTSPGIVYKDVILTLFTSLGGVGPTATINVFLKNNEINYRMCHFHISIQKSKVSTLVPLLQIIQFQLYTEHSI